MSHPGKILMAAGLIIFIAGLIIWLAGSKMHWLGHLPGDIRIEKENIRFYFPLTTMILVSAVISFILWIIRKFFS